MIATITALFDTPEFKKLSEMATTTNPWTTQEFIDVAISAITSEFLDADKVDKFCTDFSISSSDKHKTVGIICAGNLPLVGFGDMFYSLLCGYCIKLKPSSKDPLMRIFGQLPNVKIVDKIEKLSGTDGIILMGSDSTCKLINEIFPNTPKLLRGSMHSTAIIEEMPTQGDLCGLFDDMFLYSGRGCRNVSHLYINKNIDINVIANKLAEIKNEKQWDLPQPWWDCYRYERTISMLKGEKIIDGNFFILKESTQHASTAIISFEYFTNPKTISKDKIQHIANKANFGKAQYPTLVDFANKESVPQFLSTL